MSMMSFFELEKISELSFECIIKRLFIVQNGCYAQKLTWRFRLSMGQFRWAAGNIFTQHSARCKLEHHCSFGLKFNVPVDFLSLRTWLKFACS